MTDIAEVLIKFLTEKSNQGNEKAGVTKRELVKETGLSSYQLTKLLQDLFDQGKVKAYRTLRLDITGRMSNSVEYRLIEQDTPTPGE